MPKRVTSLRAPFSRHCARENGRRNVATVNLRPPALETNTLPLDQLAGTYEFPISTNFAFHMNDATHKKDRLNFLKIIRYLGFSGVATLHSALF